MAALGCSIPSVCPDNEVLQAYWKASQAKAQGLSQVYVEARLLDAKAAYDITRLAVAAVKALGAGVTELAIAEAVTKATADAAKSNNFFRDGFDSAWMKPDGSVRWPDIRGFIGPIKQEVLSVGTKIDRYGADTGKFFAPIETSFGERALPASAKLDGFNAYEVIKPLPVNSGKAIPWFGAQGLGTQYEAGMSVSRLIEEGYIRIAK